jgi:hypothetical protein
MRIVIGLVATLLIVFSSMTVANDSEEVWKSKDGNVTLVLSNQDLFKNVYVKKITVMDLSKGKNCVFHLKGGRLKGKLNTKVSVNWASFDYNAGFGAQYKVSGIVTDPNIHTYVQTNVKWPELKNKFCKIPGGDVKVYLSQ